MSRRAAIFTQSDLDRATKAAAKVGYVVRIRPGEITLAPIKPSADNSSVPESDGESRWDAALRQVEDRNDGAGA